MQRDTNMFEGLLSYPEIVDKVSELDCPNAKGFEGAETYPDCGKCVVCYCKNLRSKE